MSYTQQILKSYRNRQRTELLKTIGYHFLEVVAVVGIFALGIAIMTLK